jgi:hypothetical protein
MEAALTTSEPAIALGDLATALKAEGMSQREMYRLFDHYRARHQDAGEEAKCDAIMDVMDCIVGYCSPSARLFDTDLENES